MSTLLTLDPALAKSGVATHYLITKCLLFITNILRVSLHDTVSVPGTLSVKHGRQQGCYYQSVEQREYLTWCFMSENITVVDDFVKQGRTLLPHSKDQYDTLC